MNVGIIGSGNIGTDLLYKVLKSKSLNCTLFSGRDKNSKNLARARELGINTSYEGIVPLVFKPKLCDIVFDCTSAQAHKDHMYYLSKDPITVIDMTPSNLGVKYVPAVTPMILGKHFSMVTCGGQSTIPIAYALCLAHQIEYIEVASSIASKSAGPATRSNLDEYIETTESALKSMCGAKEAKAILILNPAEPPIDMQTTVYAKIKSPDLYKINKYVNQMVDRVQKYVPGYSLLVPPIIEGDTVIITIKVVGAGDYLPPYAGNLDIINCAAIALAEEISDNHK